MKIVAKCSTFVRLSYQVHVKVFNETKQHSFKYDHGENNKRH